MSHNTSTAHIQPIADFDWDAYEATDHRRKHNPEIKVKNSKDKVYSYDPNAQQLYDLIQETTDNLVIPQEGHLVRGTVDSIGNRYAYINIGWRESALLDLHKERPEYLEDIIINSEIDVIIKKSNLHRSSELEVSYTEAIKHVKYIDIYENIGKPAAFLAHVKELIHGGYFLDIEGVSCFMPGSLGGVNKLVNFEELLDTYIYVCPINYSKEKDYIVVSHRDYLQALIPQALEDIDPGDSFGGFVTGVTRFGVFVEFNKCLTGLVHKSDLDDETLEKFNTRVLKPGDEIEFTVKELASNDRIILTQKEFIRVTDPWSDVLERYNIPSEVTGKIRKKTKYGLFIELEPKIVGLLHVSDIPDHIALEDLVEGNDITLNLVKIELESKRVFFKI